MTTQIFSKVNQAIETGRKTVSTLTQFQWEQEEQHPVVSRDDGGFPIFILEIEVQEAGYAEYPDVNGGGYDWEEYGESRKMLVVQETKEGKVLIYAWRKFGYHNSGYMEIEEAA